MASSRCTNGWTKRAYAIREGEPHAECMSGDHRPDVAVENGPVDQAQGDGSHGQETGPAADRVPQDDEPDPRPAGGDGWRPV